MAKSPRFSTPVAQFLHRGRGKPAQPLKEAVKSGRSTKTAKPARSSGVKPDQAEAATDEVIPLLSTDKPGRVRPLDGEGRPYITLAQFMKKHELAGSGGQAKSIVRVGGILVNGAAENRPGRKLHAGDLVRISGKDYRVEL